MSFTENCTLQTPRFETVTPSSISKGVTSVSFYKSQRTHVHAPDRLHCDQALHNFVVFEPVLGMTDTDACLLLCWMCRVQWVHFVWRIALYNNHLLLHNLSLLEWKWQDNTHHSVLFDAHAAECAWDGGYTCRWGQCVFRMCLWQSLYALYSLACKVTVLSDLHLCCLCPLLHVWHLSSAFNSPCLLNLSDKSWKIIIITVMEIYAAPKLSQYMTALGAYNVKSFTYEINQHKHEHTHTHTRACTHPCSHTHVVRNKNAWLTCRPGLVKAVLTWTAKTKMVTATHTIRSDCNRWDWNTRQWNLLPHINFTILSTIRLGNWRWHFSRQQNLQLMHQTT